MSHFHQDCTLRLSHVQLHMAYDGSVVCETFADVIGPDGRPADVKHGYGHRIAPNRWHALNVPQLVKEALDAHHSALGLRPPDPDVVLHLHPQGFFGAAAAHYAPVPEAPQREVPGDHEQRVADDVRRAKADELGVPVEQVPAHPRSERSPQ